MNTSRSLLAGALALALGVSAAGLRATAPAEPPLHLADMGMGDMGPQLGGSSDDMIVSDPGRLPSQPGMVLDNPGHIPSEPDMQLDDPGRLPAEPNMVVDDPGHDPAEANMDIQQPQDLDTQDDIDP